MHFIAISQNDDSGQFFDDLIYPVDTKEQIAAAVAEMAARGIDQLPVFSTSLTIDELHDVAGDSFPIAYVLTAVVR